MKQDIILDIKTFVDIKAECCIQNPSIKMSKSTESQKGVIYLLDDLEIVRKKIMSAKTDALNKIAYDPINQPGVSNLVVIYSALTNISFESIEDKYKNSNYNVFKKDLADVLVKFLVGIQKKYKEAYKNYEKEILPILKSNKVELNKIANKKLALVYKKIGIEK